MVMEAICMEDTTAFMGEDLEDMGCMEVDMEVDMEVMVVMVWA